METESLDIQEFYNDVAAGFADEWYANDSLLPVLRQFLALLPSVPRVLDLGCGAGYESMRLKTLGAAVVGVDYSIEPIKIAREKNPDINFEVMDFRFLNPELGLFDGIAALASLIHIPEDGLDQVFGSMKTVLNKGGFIMVIVIEGRGLSTERSCIERNGRKYRRNFYLHERAALTTAAGHHNLSFHDEFELPEELRKSDWKCFVFKSETLA